MKVDALDLAKLAAVVCVGVLAYRAARTVQTATAEALDTAGEWLGATWDTVAEAAQKAVFEPMPVDSRGALQMAQPGEAFDDPAVARWLIDNRGTWTAMKWATTGAMLRAAWMDTGSGKPPPKQIPND